MNHAIVSQQISKEDRSLLEQTFLLKDPRILSGLCDSIPSDSVGLPQVEFEYDARPHGGKPGDGSYVKCAHCDKPNHWRGYVMKYTDDRRITVGKDCGHAIYGLNFGEIERAFTHKRTRKSLLSAFLGKLELMPSALGELSELLNSSTARSLTEKQDHLQRYAPDLMQKLRRLSQRPDLWLTLPRKQRDFAAEERRSNRNDAIRAELESMTTTERKKRRKSGSLPRPEDESKQIFTSVDEPFMLLEGPAFVRTSVADTLSTLSQQVISLSRVHHMMNALTSDMLSNKRLADETMNVRDCADAILKTLELLSDASRFLTTQHISRLVEWANSSSSSGFRYEMRGGVLVVSTPDNSDAEFEIDVSLPVQLPDAEIVKKLAL